MQRRRFLQSLAVAAVAPSVPAAIRAAESRFAALRPDPDRIIDLPAGFSYRILSRAGERMDDGLQVPNAHDGMAAFAADNGRIILVCNHELAIDELQLSAYGPDVGAIPDFVWSKMYDAGQRKTPSAGGTTTTIYDPASGRVERRFLSLAGTEINCAGGPTPWGSWLSCEESFSNPGSFLGRHREQPHGYVFEVPAQAAGLVEPQPIKAMGKFMHEAAAVHAASGIVYLTEDRHNSLFYRYIPNQRGQLLAGGRLQALAIVGNPSFTTDNWSQLPDLRVGESLPTRWLDLDQVDRDTDDLREDGADLGAARFARGEGLWATGDCLAFTCTIGGRARLGQVFSYMPSAHEGTPQENDSPGQLTLIAEANENSLLQNADNITLAPWGDLLVCEDTGAHCGIVGIGPDGTQYTIADNAYSNSELAGACFSPAGDILFVNIQYPGMTLAITGPWPSA
ncbi:MAG: PhoX family protein [Gammaproteobacteria bacterium]|nr:PhoX family protein [Gammaproteobacteria bacterium]MDH5303486.1 PhoX family protein [Gammaproteobacteria bacterium]MDH5321515.1 PhoX family protein [Gammaproteobacteria bacterium]